jgi:hypothetical protein
MLNMLQNNSDILAVFVQRSVGSLLFDLANDSRAYLNITLDPITIDYDDSSRGSSWYGSRSAVIFITVSICILVFLCASWFIFYCCQRYRSRTAKDNLQNRLANAAKKAISKIPLVTLTQNPQIEESCVICLDNIKTGDTVRQIICGHTFHQQCVDPWLLNHRHCPLCNLDILAVYRVSVPTNRRRRCRRRSVGPENPVPSYQSSLATSAAVPIAEQQTIINMQLQPIQTISGAIKNNDEENLSFDS